MHIKKAATALMKQNQRTVDGHFFTVPSSERYPFQWLWDSCFHAYIYSALGRHAAAEKELSSLLSRQLPSGRIPHIIFWKEPDIPLPNWGREHQGHDINRLFQTAGTSNLTQPPLIARAYYDLYLKTHDLKTLTAVYDQLQAYFSYLHTNRTDGQSRILSIVNPDESGEDNARRFDEPLGLAPTSTEEGHLSARLALMKRLSACDFDTKTCMQKHFAVADLSFNCIYADGLKAMAQIARQIGKDAESSEYSRLRSALVNEMRERLSADGTHFVSRDLIAGRNLPATEWTRFMPLYAGMVSKAEAAKLVAELFDSDSFLSAHGARTLSKKDIGYEPSAGFWRGPIWHAPHFFLYKGLRRYGFDKEARVIKEKTSDLLKTSGFYEYYDAETGVGLGAQNFTWGALYLAMD
jgi:glycogen debranching enzyme